MELHRTGGTASAVTWLQVPVAAEGPPRLVGDDCGQCLFPLPPLRSCELIEQLATAGDIGKDEDDLHVVRMSRYCRNLALAAGLGAEFAETMLRAAPYHDIGKACVPDHILLKPAGLDPLERAIMRQHAAVGAEILRAQPGEPFRTAANIALTHHERWDGDGYPNGFRGDEIPVEGRIAALCDVFDALTSVRPYKKSWPLEEVLGYIRDNAGRHFDPRLARTFLDAAPEIAAPAVSGG